jgi:hypothetical protein
MVARSLRLLRESVQNGNADFGGLNEDAELDPIRDEREFAEIMTAAQPDRRYVAVWSADTF